ncbi:hypothetical protein T10_11818 [Trichinella papuae]|uniref:Uncharacterized protein n=1 Tax=Trichinella papuae TaxID=268474 RepID=A0A0V1M4X8_9BILA|nr:hypothetical protein T10_11818 [Trichinella papuae]
MKSVPQIYSEEAGNTSADLGTAGRFPACKNKTGRKISTTSSSLSVARNYSALAFALVYCITIRKDIGTYVEIFSALIEKSAHLPSSLQCKDHFRASTSKAATFISAKQFCGRRQILECRPGTFMRQQQRKSQMLLGTAFLPLHKCYGSYKSLV